MSPLTSKTTPKKASLIMAKRKSYNTRALVNVARTSYKHILDLLRRNDIEPQDSLRSGKRVYMRWGQDAMDFVESWRYSRDADKLEQMLAAERETAKPSTEHTAVTPDTEASLRQELFRALQKLDMLNSSVAYLRGEVATLSARVMQQITTHPQPSYPFSPIISAPPSPYNPGYTYTNFGVTHRNNTNGGSHA